MPILINSRSILLTIFMLLLVQVGYLSNQVIVKFLYFNPRNDPRFCETCPSWVAFYNDFIIKNETITRIQRDYSEVGFEWIDFNSPLGIDEKQRYNVSSPNSLVINSELGIEGNFNETYIREAIDAVLEGSHPANPPSKEFLPTVALAFTFGFFESFSPCLIALLSFVLSYTIGKTARSKESFMQVMAFGFGFVVAALIIGLTLGLAFLLLQPFQILLMWIASVLALVLGLNLVGLLKIPLETKPMLQRLTKKVSFTFGGLILLGFVFYFLDPCIAPIFFAMLPVLSPEALPAILLVFSIGVIIPFILIGLLAGSISKLARTTYKNRNRIRLISGLILIGYAAYILIFHLI